MSKLKQIGSMFGKGAVALVGGALLVVLIVGITAAIGGLAGAGIAAAYNIVFGVSYGVWKAAVVGSIVAATSAPQVE